MENLLAQHERVFVAGAGVSGKSSALLLNSLQVPVVLVDDSTPAAETVKALADGATDFQIATTAEAHMQLRSGDLVVTSPGWRPDTPFLVAAAQAGCEVIGDVELVWRLDQSGQFGAPRTWCVVTGTNGKTTATGMLEAMFKAGGVSARAAGNIGVGIADVVREEPRIDVVVAELSSFQLHWAPQLTPDAGILLNLAEDHLDWHGGMDAYAAAKARALRGPIAVVGWDDRLVRTTVGKPGVVADDTTVVKTGLADPDSYGDNGVGVSEGRLVSRIDGEETPVVDLSEISPAGPAGAYDAAAAMAVALRCGVDAHAIERSLRTFEVAGHRGQTVAQAGGVSWVDNSKATNPHAADGALAGYDSVVWIAGGQLKGAHVTDLVQTHADRLRGVVALGVDRQDIIAAVEALGRDIPIHEVTTTNPVAAMEECVHWAGEHAQPGDVVLLAPAAASLDMFTGMGQRGDEFARAARKWCVACD